MSIQKYLIPGPRDRTFNQRPAILVEDINKIINEKIVGCYRDPNTNIVEREMRVEALREILKEIEQ